MTMLFARARDVDWDAARWPNFRPPELACHCGGRFCGGQYYHDPDFLDSLQRIRDALGKPVRVNSGHRCALWNASVRGAPLSVHKTIAIDVALGGVDPLALVENAAAAGFTGFGFARTFLHIDRRKRPARWDYGAVSREFWAREMEGHPWETFFRA